MTDGGAWIDTNYIATANGDNCDYALTTDHGSHTSISPGAANDKVDRFFIAVTDPEACGEHEIQFTMLSTDDEPIVLKTITWSVTAMSLYLPESKTCFEKYYLAEQSPTKIM